MNEQDQWSPRVAVVVLTWNQRDVTLECLASLRAQHHQPTDIVVVDNGSTDRTVEAIRAGYPEVTLIENGANLGYVGGNNAGLRHVLAGDAEYILVLNNDTDVDPGMIDHLLAVMEPEPSIGITGPKMLYYDQPETIWCAGNRINWRNGDSIRLQAEQSDGGDGEAPRDVDFITGCAICLRRDVIEQIGLLDERFFIYYEETDWCVRARRAGWRTVYVPRARLRHKVSLTMGTTSPATDYYMTRNSLLFLAKNRRGLARVWSLAWLLGRIGRIVAAYSVKNRDPERLRSRDARLLGVRDALLGRWGKMGPDVARLCYPGRS